MASTQALCKWESKDGGGKREVMSSTPAYGKGWVVVNNGNEGE